MTKTTWSCHGLEISGKEQKADAGDLRSVSYVRTQRTYGIFIGISLITIAIVGLRLEPALRAIDREADPTLRGKNKPIGGVKENVKPKMILVIAGIVVAALTVTASSASAATIWTDKSDYQPGEVVYISGEDFQASATVSLSVTRPDSTSGTGATVTDSSGKFSNYPYQLNGIEGVYNVTAADGFGNYAETTFTDKVTIPEFSTIAIPVATIIGLMFLVTYRKRRV